jgi:hypothetical protein
MNRTLRRPMFRMGGAAEGITSGLDQPRKQYAQGTPNPYAPSVNFGGVPGFLTGLGLNLLATPPQGGLLATTATAAQGPFKNLQESQAARRKLESEKEFLRSERLEGQEFEEGLLDKRLEVEKMKINSGDSLTVNQLAAQYLDDYDGDLNKATNKAKFFLEVRPQLAGTVGDTQIGGIIESDLSNEKQAKAFAQRNRNKVGKVFWDINTGKLVKLVKDSETNKLGFVDFNVTGDMTPDTEGEILSEANENEVKPKQSIKEVFQPGLTDTDKFIMETINEGKEKRKKGEELIPNYNIYR